MKIKSIKRMSYEGAVYNFTEPNNHNYYANGILVHNCDFCYMDSTVNGEHAKYKDISNTLKAMADMKVFEVAIGGGAPVSHPDFVKILKRARSLGITPNFTTRSIAWLSKPIADQILKYAGAFAVSVSDHKQIIKLAKILDVRGIHANERDRVNLHVVMGTVTREEFRRIIVMASRKGLRVTLLGFKETGRGIGFDKIDYSWWLDDIEMLRQMDLDAPDFEVRSRKRYVGITQSYLPDISIDTVMAKDYEKELLNHDIPSWLFHTVDGAFSAYVDAVNNHMGPASYENFDKMVVFNPNSKTLAQDMRKIYRAFDVNERESITVNPILHDGGPF